MTEKIKILKDRTENQEEDSIIERHPDWPHLDVSFYFAPHSNSRDMEGIAPYIEKADILLYENVGRTPATRKLYDRISQHPTEGIEDVIDNNRYKKSPIRGHATEPLVRGIYDSGKAIGTLDIGKNDSDVQLEKANWASLSKIASPSLSYSSALVMTKNFAREAAFNSAEREERMAENFEEEMEFIFKTRPDLLDKDSVSVLISIGSFHTSLARRLNKRGIETTHNFSKGPDYVYNYPGQLQRDYMYGVEPTVELIEDTLSDQIIQVAYGNELVAEDTQIDETSEFIRRYVSSLSPEAHEKLFNIYKADRLSIDTINTLMQSGPNQMKLVKTGAEIEKANKNYHIRVKKLGKAVSH